MFHPHENKWLYHICHHIYSVHTYMQYTKIFIIFQCINSVHTQLNNSEHAIYMKNARKCSNVIYFYTIKLNLQQLVIVEVTT